MNNTLYTPIWIAKTVKEALKLKLAEKRRLKKELQEKYPDPLHWN